MAMLVAMMCVCVGLGLLMLVFRDSEIIRLVHETLDLTYRSTKYVFGVFGLFLVFAAPSIIIGYLHDGWRGTGPMLFFVGCGGVAIVFIVWHVLIGIAVMTDPGW